MGDRRPLSRSVRFEVFKRDRFTCQYCGRHPPDVMLECDHIQPVADGGPDDQDNLITACFDCNRGKAARLLTVVPESLPEKATRIAEAEAQLMGYREIMREVEARKENDAWEVIEAIYGMGDTTKARFQSVRNFLNRLPFEEVLEAGRIAAAARIYSDDKRFRYFCGVCWNKIGEADGSN